MAETRSVSSNGKDLDLALVAHAIDRECQRLGYQSVVRQRRNGAEFVCVPALVQNCSALLVLLTTGGVGGRNRSVAERVQQLCLQEKPQHDANTSSCTITATSRSIYGTSTGISRYRGVWKKIFARRFGRKTNRAVVATGDDTTTTEIVDLTKTDEESASDRKQTNMESCLKYLLKEIRLGTEHLVSLSGLSDDEESHAEPQERHSLTELQREVLYFQTRWPQVVQSLSAKLTETDRATRRVQEEASAKSKAEAGARTRSMAKMASMEAELRRLRTELRRYDRKAKRPVVSSYTIARGQPKSPPQKSILRQIQSQLSTASSVAAAGGDSRRSTEVNEATELKSVSIG